MKLSHFLLFGLGLFIPCYFFSLRIARLERMLRAEQVLKEPSEPSVFIFNKPLNIFTTSSNMTLTGGMFLGEGTEMALKLQHGTNWVESFESHGGQAR